VVLLAALALGGCASGPKPTAQLVRASTLVSEAEKNQAQRYAAADLQHARDELSEAQTADSDSKYDQARSLAEKAAADADLASARAASGKARQSADEVHRNLDTLRQQLQQSPEPPGNTGPGQDHP
jgi:thiamine kinase-like enzyme